MKKKLNNMDIMNQTLEQIVLEREEEEKKTETLKSEISIKERKIEELEESQKQQEAFTNDLMNQTHQQAEDSKAQLSFFREELSKHRGQGPEILTKLFQEACPGRTKEFDEESSLRIFDTDIEQSDFLQQCAKYSVKLTNMKQIWINKVYEDDQVLNEFLERSFPDEVKSFVLNWGVNASSDLEMESICGRLCRVLGGVTYELFLGRFVITGKQLENIINNLKCEKLVLSNCKILCQMPPVFTNSTIKELSFFGCGDEENSNWDQNRLACKNLFKGFCLGRMKKTLKKINVSNCGLAPSWFKRVLRESRMNSNIIATSGSSNPIGVEEDLLSNE